MIVIINYGMGNIGSLQNMIRKVGGDVIVSSEAGPIEKADKLVLPGVGAFDNGMKRLRESGLADVICRKVMGENIPILCICLGIQLLTESSEEGSLPGLRLISGKTIRFRFKEEMNLKIPHMGWNSVSIKKESPLFHDMYDEPCFYFVHSYHVVCDSEEDILTTTNYGIDFVSSVQHGNIYATQFHPEKSHKFGMKVIKNFVELA